jgi:hypothetical protein
MDETHLTPEQARERFGELTAPAGNNRVHVHFSGPDGSEWRPEFDGDMHLVGYRLFRFRKPGGRKVSFRPKGKR